MIIDCLSCVWFGGSGPQGLAWSSMLCLYIPLLPICSERQRSVPDPKHEACGHNEAGEVDSREDLLAW